MNTFVAILGLAFLILIHEAGHFFTAIMVGMRPRKFYLGFPPPLAKVRRRGIEYGVGAIPLGGYVKIPGMHRPAAGDLDYRLQRAVADHPELVQPFESVKRALAVGDDAEALAALDQLEAALTRAGQPVAALDETRDALSPDAYWRQRPWKKMLVIFAGPGTNALFAILLFAALNMVSGGPATPKVGDVVPKTPAARAGLHAGDHVVAINGHPIRSGSDVPRLIVHSHGRPLVLRVQRDGGIVTLPPARPEKIEGAYRLGFVLTGRGVGPVEALGESLRTTGLVSRDIITSLGSLVHSKGRKDISSPVGIVQGSSAAANRGIQNYLWVLGLISLSLALLNMLPLLPLDGGHIFFSLLEAIRGRAVAREVYERFSAVGIALVLMLFFIGLTNDVGRLGGG